MTDQIDLASSFRRIINKRYHFYAWMNGLAIAICLLFFWLSTKEGFLASLSTTALAFSIGLMIRNLLHAKKMLFYLDRSKHDHFNQLERYLEAKQNEWQNNHWRRLLFGSMTFLTMFFLLIFFKDTYWTMPVSSLCIVLILAIAILGWIDFNDQVLLHDIRRSHRDQASNIPE